MEALQEKPSEQSPKRVLTRNRMGWASEQLYGPSVLFVEFCKVHPDSLVLDIGAAYGAASLAALHAGARVTANDLDAGHLQQLRERASGNPNLTLSVGRFPRDLHFEDASVAAVHASNVFHFLTGNQLEYGMRAIARWLQPGGKVFIQAAAPYQAPFAAFAEEYERRLSEGVKWPGWIEKVSVYARHRQMSQMPRAMHLLEDRVLTRVLSTAGLEVEQAWLYRRGDLPRTLHWDGRETVGAVGRKPAI